MTPTRSLGIFLTVLLVLALTMPFLGLYNEAVQWGILPKSLWFMLGIWVLSIGIAVWNRTEEKNEE